MKAVAILLVAGGKPKIDSTILPLHGWVLLRLYGDMGIYVVSGTPAQLQALDAATTICAGGVILDWPRVTSAITPSVLARINGWLTARAKPTIPADTTWASLLQQLGLTYEALHFDIDDDDPTRELPRIQAIFVAPQVAQLAVPIAGPHFRLADVGQYTLWQVDTNAANALALHNALYALAPAATLGALAVVKEFGVSFEDSAIRTATGMTLAQANARRNRIANYLDSLGKSTVALRAATTEGAQMAGVATALGYTIEQVWSAMVS